MKTIKLSQRKKEVFITIITNLCLQLVTAVCGFILPPLIVKTFGSSVNGMVSSISQFISYLNIVEAGVGGASIAALYKPLAEKKTIQINEILSATAKFYNRSGILFTILVLILGFVYPLIIGKQVDRTQSALMVLILGITGAAEFFLIGKYRVLLTADRKIYILSIVQMLALILSTTLASILIKTGQNILIVKLAAALLFLFRYVFLSLFVHKHYPDVDYHTTPNTKAISQSKNVLVHQIGVLVVFNSPLIIITIFCTLKEASIYTIYAMVFTAINSLLGAFSNGMQAFFGESLVSESIERTQKVFIKFETVFFAVEGWVYTMAYLLIMPFMHLYTAQMTDAQYIRPKIAVMFVCFGILNNLRNPSSQLINAAGHFKKTQFRCIIEVIINLICSCLFTIIFGFQGVIAGSICSGFYRAIDMIMYTRKYILNSMKLCFTTIVKIFILLFIYVVIAFLVSFINFDFSSYLRWVLFACVYGVLVAIPLILFLFFYKKILK